MGIEMHGVRMSYGKKEVLHGIDLELGKGICGLLGPNGAGKSTLLGIMVTALAQSSGKVLWDGADIHDRRTGYLRVLGFLPQSPGIYRNYTAREFMRYMAALKGIKDSAAMIDELLDFVDLRDEKDQKTGTFSGGMLRRVGIAQALLGDPRIVILDEPTAGLDPLERIRLRALLSRISNDRTVLIATHIVSDIEYIANRVIIMYRGSIISQGRPDELCDSISGKVFACRVPYAQVEEIAANYRVSNIFTDKDCCTVRVVSPDRPLENAVPVRPTLDDVFVCLCSGTAVKAQ